MPDKDPKKTNDNNWVYLAIYFFGILGGIIAYIMEKDNKKVRFHAMQSIFLGIIMIILSFTIILGLFNILIWLYGMYIGYKEYTGVTVRIPYLAEYADKYA
jgi:uncharacterized membrane protein